MSLLASGAGSGERDVHVDLIYVSCAPSRWDIGAQFYTGPRFGMPLRNVRWVFYLPERGVVVELTRPLQVKPDSEMMVTCRADTMPGAFPGIGIVCAAGVFVAAAGGEARRGGGAGPRAAR